MKGMNLLAMLIAISLPSCIKDLVCIEGNGKINEDHRNTGSFTAASNTTTLDVVYRLADSVSVTITGESNFMSHIVTENFDGRLEIRTDPKNACFTFSQKPVITLTAPALTFIENTGPGSFSADTIKGDSVVIRSTSSGDLSVKRVRTGNLEIVLTSSGKTEISEAYSENASLTVTGSGNLHISGRSREGVLQSTASGDIEAGEFVLLRANETITGSGNILTRVVESLNAVITGSGNIHLSGDPVITQSITGSGKIIRN